MKFPGAKRRPPFVTLPRHKRSHEVIRLKGKMRRDAAEYGGRFTSHLVLNEPAVPICTTSGLTSTFRARIGSLSGTPVS